MQMVSKMNWGQACSLLMMLLLFSLLTVMTACGVTREVYKPNPPDANALPLQMKIAVIELDDRNPDTRSGSGLCLIPGVLYCAGPSSFSNPTAFASCLASDLRSSGFFDTVDYYTGWDEISKSFTSYALVLTGDLRHDTVAETQTAYGLSALGIYVYWMGVPGKKFTREASFDITGFPANHPDKVILRETINFEESLIGGAYYGPTIQEQRTAMDSYGPENLIFSSCPTEKLRPHFLKIRQKTVEFLQAGSLTKVHLGTKMLAIEGALTGEKQ